MKKLLSLILSGLMLIGILMSTAVSTAANGMPYTDVPSGNWYHEPILYAYENNLMNGMTENTFEPDTSMSRAMFVTVLGRIHGADKIESSTFPDVIANSYYSGYVGWSVEAGIIGGYPEGDFRPDNSILRSEAAKIIVCYIDYIKMTALWDADAPSVFGDADAIPEWSKDFVESLRSSGIIAGDDNGNFNPNGTLTRAEAATIFMRLHKMKEYLRIEDPIVRDYKSENGDYYLLGAYDMFYSGSALTTSYNGTKVTSNNNMTLLTEDQSGRKHKFKATVDENNTKGLVSPSNPSARENYFALDMKILNVSPNEYPVVRVGYVSDGDIKIGISADSTNTVTPKSVQKNDLKYAVADLSEFKCWSDASKKVTVTFTTEDKEISLVYVAFFKTPAEAENFNFDGYLEDFKSYSGSVSKLNPLDSTSEKKFNDRADNLRDSIVNCKDDIDPSTIKGTCYYISSIHGDDSNKGTSPDQAWKSIQKLYRYKANNTVIQDVPEPGDAVFFERGSTFYPTIKTNMSGEWVLTCAKGVTYAAYGEGDKPVFNNGVDLSSPSNWEKTEYGDSIWKCAQTFVSTYNDIGNMVFDDELWGVRVLTLGAEMGKGIYAEDCGVVTNGRDTYSLSGLEFVNPGSMTEDLMYFQNWNTGELFLVCKDGNPGNVFKKIIASKCGRAISAGKDVVVDNLAMRYSGAHAITFGDNSKITNCDIRWIGGGLQGDGYNSLVRFGNAMEEYGSTENILIERNYVDQVYDAGLTVQTTGGVMKNVTFRENLIERSNMSIEIFNSNTVEDPENINIFVTGNIIRYAGYGIGNMTPQHERKGTFMMGFQGGKTTVKCTNYVFEENLCLYTAYCSAFDVDFALGSHSNDGLILRNNTYIVNGDVGYHLVADENLLTENSGNRCYYPYTEQYLTYLSESGIDTGSEFYAYSGFRFVGESDGAYRFPEID